ncbi:MAG: DUF72 domain-containing protein [Bacteroidales bacterium]|nr:DUF72 domain-containing protein [Candidatus Latescibacterota bacterium]
MRSTLYIGPAGWSYPDWEGPVYPPGAGIDRLRFIARYFNCVELNSSFYRTPSPKIVRSWAERIGYFEHFHLTVKVLKKFTHLREFDRDGLLEFIDRFAPIEDAGRLGAFLLQFPWSFRNDLSNLEYLQKVAEVFRGRPVVVEVRHGSWKIPETEEFFRNNGLAFCNIDQPVIGDSIAPSNIVTREDVGYIRLHGRNYDNWFKTDAGRDARYDYLYDPEELAAWKSRAISMLGKVRNLFIITNNHFQGQALVNGFQLSSMIKGAGVKMPSSLVRSYPSLEDYLDRSVEDLDLS